MMTGKEFEHLFANLAKQIYGDDCQIYIDTDIDKYEGTDLVVNGLRIDVTLRDLDTKYDDAKDYTEVIGHGQYGNSSCIQVEFGYRTGNKHGPFEEPVLVIACHDISGYLTRGEDWAIEDFKTRIDDIIRSGEDYFWKYDDAIAELDEIYSGVTADIDAMTDRAFQALDSQGKDAIDKGTEKPEEDSIQDTDNESRFD